MIFILSKNNKMNKSQDKDFLNELNPSNSYAFIHKTHNEYLIDILESGYLLPCNLTNKENYTCVENKVFMSLVRPSDKIKYDVVSENEPILIFDSKIYMDYGIKNLCHFSLGWNYGRIDLKNTLYFNSFKTSKSDSEIKKFTKNEKLRLNLNYLDVSLGIQEDFIGGVPFTFNTQNELVLYDRIPIDKYLKYILISPYMKTRGRYQKEGSPFDVLKNKDMKLYEIIMEKYGHLIIDSLEKMEDKNVQRYINLLSFQDLSRYEEFEKMLRNYKNM